MRRYLASSEPLGRRRHGAREGVRHRRRRAQLALQRLRRAADADHLFLLPGQSRRWSARFICGREPATKRRSPRISGGSSAISIRICRIYNVRTLNAHIETNLVFRRVPARLFAVLGPLILVLAAIGIYAVVAYADVAPHERDWRAPGPRGDGTPPRRGVRRREPGRRHRRHDCGLADRVHRGPRSARRGSVDPRVFGGVPGAALAVSASLLVWPERAAASIRGSRRTPTRRAASASFAPRGPTAASRAGAGAPLAWLARTLARTWEQRQVSETASSGRGASAARTSEKRYPDINVAGGTPPSKPAWTPSSPTCGTGCDSSGSLRSSRRWRLARWLWESAPTR